MKRIVYLLRHAKSSWSDPGLKDFDRPLNTRGVKACEMIGQFFKKQGINPGLVLSSPSVRTRSTVERIAAARGEAFAETLFEPALYGASALMILERLQTLSDDLKSVMVVGHNPAIQDLALAMAARGKAALIDQIERKYPTGALAAIEFKDLDWADLRRGSGTLTAFTPPKHLRRHALTK